MTEAADVVQIVLVVLLFIVNAVNIGLTVVTANDALSSYNSIKDFDSIIDKALHPFGI